MSRKTSICKSDIVLFEITQPDSFLSSRKNARELSDFEASMLTLIGNALRCSGSQHFWSNGQYSWYRDGKQEKIDRVWLTDNGIVILEKETDDGSFQLFRLHFNF